MLLEALKEQLNLTIVKAVGLRIFKVKQLAGIVAWMFMEYLEMGLLQ